MPNCMVGPKLALVQALFVFGGSGTVRFPHVGLLFGSFDCDTFLVGKPWYPPTSFLGGMGDPHKLFHPSWPLVLRLPYGLVDHRPFLLSGPAQIKDKLPPPSSLRFFPLSLPSLSPTRRTLVYIKVPFSVWCVRTFVRQSNSFVLTQQPGIYS